MDTQSVPPSQQAGKTRFFVCGAILVLLGTALLGLFAAIGAEGLIAAAGPPQSIVDSQNEIVPNPAWDAYTKSAFPLLVIAVGCPLVAIVGCGIGYFACRRKAPPTWYIVVFGLIPGFILAVGWGAVHS